MIHARNRRYGYVVALFSVVLLVPCAWAQEGGAIDPGDTAWLLVSSALVLLMTPALGFFYAGMVRRKNVLATIMHSFFMVALISVQWLVIGYTLSFGPDQAKFLGGLDHAFLRGVGAEPKGTVPHAAFMIFQGMFAIITPALITGAFAERMKFGAFVLFSLLWATFVYDPVCHWVWGGGWLGELGALDFAGGTVVHINSGVAALAAALVIGPRLGYPREQILPNNLGYTVLGAGILWFGWFGFNAGSALAADGLAATAFVATHMAAAAATLAWAASEYFHRGKASVLGAASGAVAGLVAITPAAGYVGPVSSVWIGVGAGVLCYAAVNLKFRLGYDDSLDVVGVHGVGGTWGALATGLFASTAVNPGGADGLFFGNPGLVVTQLVGVAATILYSFVVTFVLLKIVDGAVGLRVSEEDEITGLDLSQHGETGYNL
ncbi:MAG: ammonium transporter [Candidatus Binatia bacterium]|nr:MAG: ammonium transporter [Candidatus Binatia bacterium]